MAADPHSAEYHAKVLSFQQSSLDKTKVADNPALLKTSIDNFTASNPQAAEYALATVYDLLRTDGSVFTVFEDVMRKLDVYGQCVAAVKANQTVFCADKAAYVLSALIGNVPSSFTEQQVAGFLELLRGAACGCSEQGQLDAVVNVLKASGFRKLVTSNPSFVSLAFDAQTASPGIVYKKLFVVWLLSFEGSLIFSAESVVQKLKETLTCSRVEKVVRMGLMCLQSLLPNHSAVADEVVEQGLLEVVQALEYEKWRDAELYEEIKSMSLQISTRVAEMSNFARYERELGSGKLKWGFIHSPKFWSENVLKFEQNDWRALKALACCLDNQDSTTVAVACRDLGEFVTAHPLGKKQIAALGVKDKVMRLMSNTSEKEVRREALLCCQKIMLNKWQDVEAA